MSSPGEKEIAHVVSIGMIDILELVDIEKNDTENIFEVTDLVFPDCLHAQPPISEPGQRIVISLKLQSFLTLPQVFESFFFGSYVLGKTFKFDIAVFF